MEHKTTRAHTELPHTRGGRPFASVPGACALRVRPGGAGQAGRGPRPASGAEGRSVGPTLSLRHGRRRKAMLCRLPWEPRGAGPPSRPPSRRRAQHVRRGHPEARRASSSLGGTREQRFESRDRFAAPRAVAEASGVGAPRLRPRGGRGRGSVRVPPPPRRWHLRSPFRAGARPAAGGGCEGASGDRRSARLRSPGLNRLVTNNLLKILRANLELLASGVFLLVGTPTFPAPGFTPRCHLRTRRPARVLWCPFSESTLSHN